MRLFLSLLFGLLLSFSLSAQTDDALQVVDVLPVDEVGTPYHMTLSPDGTMLAWGEAREGLCLYTFETEATTCTPYPRETDDDDDIDLRDHTPLRWSPDGRTIALTENWTQGFAESDIWLFDVESQTFSNLTDDGLSGSVMMMDEDDEYRLDALPLWDANSGDLYFFRYLPLESGRGYRAELHRSRADGDDFDSPDRVTELPFSGLPVYHGIAASVGSGAAISPNGERMAILMRPASAPNSTVWIIDTDGDDLEEIATFDDFQGVGLPEWHTTPMSLDGITWMDDATLLISTINPGTRGDPINNMLYTLTLDGDVSALVDLSDVPDANTYLSTDGSAYPAPRAALVAQQGDGVFAVNFNRAASRYDLSFYGLDGAETVLHSFDPQTVRFIQTAQHSMDMSESTLRLLIYGYVFTLEGM